MSASSIEASSGAAKPAAPASSLAGTRSEPSASSSSPEEICADAYWETKDHPMTPGAFEHALMVRGFSEENGRDYNEYCTKWRAHYDELQKEEIAQKGASVDHGSALKRAWN